ncbi:nucleotidyl transferase AbiEii/AbiGii toxin family protein [Myxococcus sp. SDU36]|uniref:nucleotidyl transferase AbiEii/AbiGii toxin family protein n=1 Tax=Myxococcus sp. SDU36 TaxID=2831967 RepID=UPI0025434481|nr:nucleotidyl transferase AbiEii/AbiGii toxin family protein [Myxococcus sp. SDU36]WIG94326.1 nucleotidyl transferase AbiEii/AbiGii toxin family protein [Myxococcus sp. SDU36]
MKALYPEALSNIRAWAKENSRPFTEARNRFAQGAILRAIASSNWLSRILVFKGGNALDFVWQPNRSTKDLDFSSIESGLTADDIQKHLGRALEQTGRSLGISFRIQKIDRQPPGPNRTFVTYQVSVGFALEDDLNNRDRIARGDPSKAVIPIDISLNEPVCGDELVEIHGLARLRVSTVDDIIAEKLRALLQQPIRKRNRCQDLLDIAMLVRTHPEINHIRIAEYLHRKAHARGVPVSHAAFDNPEVSQLARVDYDSLKQTARTFIPFEEAWLELRALVAQLSLD